MGNIKVVIYEDKEVYRNSLCGSFELVDGFELSGAFANCNKLAQQMQELQPDVVLMDIEMQNGFEGIDGLKTIQQNFPGIKVIMLTGVEDNERIYRCIRAGASGYILKGRDHFTKIFENILAVKNGERILSPAILSKVTNFIVEGIPQNTDKFGLTEAEQNVLIQLAKGLSEKQIADALNISKETAHKHKSNIYTKLNVHSETEAVKFARDHRLLPPEMLRHIS